MALTLGISGLPTSGKTTLFNALTGSQALTSVYGHSSDEPNVAMVKVPDNRLNSLTEMFHPRKTTPADVQYLDVGGLAAGDSTGATRSEGLSRKFLGAIAATDALVLVVRAFDNPTVPHPQGSVDPLRDLEGVTLELIFSDLGIIERRLQRLKAEIGKTRAVEREAQERELALLERMVPQLEENRPIRALGLSEDEQKIIRNYQFLSNKPWLIAFNLGESNLDGGPELVAAARKLWSDPGVDAVAVCAQLEMEIAQLPPDDATEFRESLGVGPSPLGQIISRSYDLLGLISFLTAGTDEVRAWTITQGTNAQVAAGVIHSDLERGFIRAEVVAYDDLVATGSMAEAKKRGVFAWKAKLTSSRWRYYEHPFQRLGVTAGDKKEGFKMVNTNAPDGNAPQTPKLAIGILTIGKPSLAMSLSSLLLQDEPNISIHIVDTSEKPVIKQEDFNSAMRLAFDRNISCTYEHNRDRNRPFSSGRRMLITALDNPNVCFMDDDVVVPGNWLRGLTELREKNPGYGFLAPAIKNAGKRRSALGSSVQFTPGTIFRQDEIVRRILLDYYSTTVDVLDKQKSNERVWEIAFLTELFRLLGRPGYAHPGAMTYHLDYRETPNWNLLSEELIRASRDKAAELVHKYGGQITGVIQPQVTT